MRLAKRLVVAVVVLAVLAVGGTFVYINLIREDAPDELTLESHGATSPDEPAPGDGDVSGTWTAGAGSQAGYRVDEILFGQDAEAVGRTEDVTGTLEIEGTTVTAVSMEADMTTVTSDQERRDNQFKGRIMDVARFPTATFELAEPIELGSVPPVGEVVEHEATGDLTLHGTTKRVTFTLKAKRTATSIEVNGSIPVVFADYGIPNPSFGPISTDDKGVMELLVVYTRG
jgi:polyisoprenoid-binding protein YceI